MSAREVKISIYNLMKEGRNEEAYALWQKYYFYFSETPTSKRKRTYLLNKVCAEIEKTL